MTSMSLPKHSMPSFFEMVFAFFSERVNNNNLFTLNGQRKKEKKLWANIAHSVILIVTYLKDRSYNLALVSQVLYHTLRRNHLGISYQSFPHSLHRHSKTLLNSKGHSVSGARIIKSLCQEDQCNTKEGLNKLKQCCWRRLLFFLAIKRVLIQVKMLRRRGTIIM